MGAGEERVAKKKIAVVGGGITGLTAAFYLQRAGLEPLVFDAGKTPGGVIRTVSRDGYLLELGPNSVQETPDIRELIEATELTGDVLEASREAKNRYIVHHDQLIPLPMSPPALLRTPLLSWKGKLRLLREPFIRPGSADSDESLAAFVRRRLGTEILDTFVNPFVSGIFAGDPEQLSARHAFLQLFELEQQHGSLLRGLKARAKAGKPHPKLISFRQGLAILPNRLADLLAKRIYRETTVESIRRTEGGWELIAARHGRRIRDTYAAILFALPARALASIRFETSGSEWTLSDLNEMPHAPIASLSLGFQRSQVDHPLDGFGMLLPEKEGRQILGTIFASTLFPGRAPEGHVLLTTFLGGTRQPELATASAKTLRRLALENLGPLLGLRGEPEFEHLQIWPQAIPQYNLGHERFLKAIDDFETENPGLIIAGPVRDGISIGQCIASGKRRMEELKKRM